MSGDHGASVGYCPDHDPITRAGFIACQACGRRGWPTDADWFGELILATYGTGCPHVTGGTWLVDPEHFDQDRRWCGAYATSTGEPCRNLARPRYGGRCHVHARREVT